MNGYFSHKVKSIWAVFLALIASMLVLSGCGGTSDGASSAANSTAVVTVDATPVPTPEVTPETLPEPTPVVTPEPTPVPTPKPLLLFGFFRSSRSSSCCFFLGIGCSMSGTKVTPHAAFVKGRFTLRVKNLLCSLRSCGIFYPSPLTNTLDRKSVV